MVYGFDGLLFPGFHAWDSGFVTQKPTWNYAAIGAAASRNTRLFLPRRLPIGLPAIHPLSSLLNRLNLRSVKEQPSTELVPLVL